LTSAGQVLKFKLSQGVSGNVISKKEIFTGCDSISAFSTIFSTNQKRYSVVQCVYDNKFMAFTALFDESEDIIKFNPGELGNLFYEESNNADNIRYRIDSGSTKSTKKA
jgi:hypothetical protein